MIKTRPRRPLDVRGPALDAPLPLIVTCAGMRLPWPSGSPDTEDADADLFASDNYAAWPTLAQRLAGSGRDNRAA